MENVLNIKNNDTQKKEGEGKKSKGPVMTWICFREILY